LVVALVLRDVYRIQDPLSIIPFLWVKKPLGANR
jgi:hypothetical protein